MSPTVLIGEDEPFFREALQWLLASHNLNVTTAENGEQVIRAIEKESPDVLILDLLMPEYDGFSVLDYMQKESISIPTIILSNLTEEIDTDSFSSLGVRHYCVKSHTDLDKIWPMVEDCLNAQSSEAHAS